MHTAYPLMLDIVDRPILIVGGGSVAARKARGLLDAGATKIRVVSPAFCGEIPAAVQRIGACYNVEHLEGAALVFAATDSAEVNSRVVRDCRDRGIWVNRADSHDADHGDFSTPAVLRKGLVTVTISTAGAPMLARAVRDGIADRFDPQWSAMAEAMQSLRPMILNATQLSPEARRSALRDLLTPAAFAALADGVESLTEWLRKRYPQITGATVIVLPDNLYRA